MHSLQFACKELEIKALASVVCGEGPASDRMAPWTVFPNGEVCSPKKSGCHGPGPFYSIAFSRWPASGQPLPPGTVALGIRFQRQFWKRQEIEALGDPL